MAEQQYYGTGRRKSAVARVYLKRGKGNIVVNSDQTKQVLEYLKRLIAFLPPDVPAWDDASNNKWLVSGKGALIMNPPSAWAVARRDRPEIAEQTWHHGMAAGPAEKLNGRAITPQGPDRRPHSARPVRACWRR